MEAKKAKTHVFEADEEDLAVKKRLRSPVKVQPPLMPLIDVMFTLMLFFLLATHIRTAEGLIASSLPEKGGSSNSVERVPTVDIPIDVRSVGGAGGGARYIFRGSMAFDDTPSSGDANAASNGLFRALEQYRDTNHLTGDTATIVIRATGDVPWQYVVDAYNQAVRAKFSKIGFAPQ
jgi:biopolymer transport protein ExbD